MDEINKYKHLTDSDITFSSDCGLKFDLLI